MSDFEDDDMDDASPIEDRLRFEVLALKSKLNRAEFSNELLKEKNTLLENLHGTIGGIIRVLEVSLNSLSGKGDLNSVAIDIPNPVTLNPMEFLRMPQRITGTQAIEREIKNYNQGKLALTEFTGRLKKAGIILTK